MPACGDNKNAFCRTFIVIVLVSILLTLTSIKFSDSLNPNIHALLQSKIFNSILGLGTFQIPDSEYMVCSSSKTICQYGRIKPGRKYAVVTSSLFDGASSINYGFSLPLSILAWHRIGYDNIVMIIGDPDKCSDDAKLSFLVKTLMSMDHVVVLVLTGFSPSHSVTISQVSRLFVESLIQDGGNMTSWQNTYVITTDADIWPIAHGFFDLPEGKEIFHGDIGKVNISGVAAIHAPLSYIGMKIRTWRDVMSTSGKLEQPHTSQAILDYLRPVFNSDCCDNVKHGGKGWDVDQTLASLRIHQWKTTLNKSDAIFIYKRYFMRDRFDRGRWQTTGSLDGMIDAHIPNNGYKPDTWKIIRPLLVKMHDKFTVSWCDQYSQLFNSKRNF